MRHVAALFTGAFESAFANGAPAAPADDKEAKKPTMPHLAKAANAGTVMVVTDVDFMSDQNSVNKMQVFNQVILRPRNDNLSFVINAVDYLGGDENLISIRSRGKISRPFTTVQNLQVEAQKRWKAEEEKLSQEVKKINEELQKLQAQSVQGNQLVLSEAQKSQIKKFQDQERDYRKKLRVVRRKLREDIENLGKVLVAANMLVVPLGVGFFGVAMFMRRNRRRRK